MTRERIIKYFGIVLAIGFVCFLTNFVSYHQINNERENNMKKATLVKLCDREYLSVCQSIKIITNLYRSYDMDHMILVHIGYFANILF